MEITGYDVMKLCEQGRSCKHCQLYNYRGTICTPLIVDIKLASLPSDVYRLCNKRFKVDIALEQQFNKNSRSSTESEVFNNGKP